MSTLSRRDFARGVLWCAGATLAAPDAGWCAPAWVVPELSLAPGQVLELALTLPGSVSRGGVFSVDPAGAPLPEGLTLSPSGRLAAEGQAPSTTRGVVFVYSE